MVVEASPVTRFCMKVRVLGCTDVFPHLRKLQLLRTLPKSVKNSISLCRIVALTDFRF
jgi:hypothetical protein